MVSIAFNSVQIIVTSLHLLSSTAKGYELITTKYAYSAASQACMDQFGTELASIHSYQEWSEAKALCETTSDNCWMGLNDIDTDKSYVWTDESPSDYGFSNNNPASPTTGTFPWASGEPNDSGDCMHLWSNANYAFDDTLCTRAFSPICNSPLITLNSVVMHVSGDYELILSQKDAREATFSANVKNTYLENEDDPDADTFTNIGDLELSDFVDDEGYYQFKLIYTNVHVWNADKSVDNNVSVTLEWKQTSWLTATTITGYTAINVPTETVTDSRRDFEGLGISSSDRALFDGDAHGGPWAWNSAGIISIIYGGMPAFDRQIAMTAALYAYRVTESAEVFIRGPAYGESFSVYCGDGVISILSASYGVSCGLTEDNDLNNLQNACDGQNTCDYTIDNIEPPISEPGTGCISSYVYQYECVCPTSEDNSWIIDFGLNTKDLFIISLLLINLIGMVCIYYRIKSKKRRSLNGKKYAEQFDEETDMEPINK